MAMWPKFFPISNTNSIKIPTSIFVEINKLILRFMWKFKECRIAKTIFEKNMVGGLIPLHCNTYYKALVIQTL